ncbi:MAG: HAD-IA family hydrolase [Microgenomates group bacterium]
MKTIFVDAAGTFVVDRKIDEKLHNLLETYQNKKIILTNANDEQLVTYGLVDLPYEMFTLKHNPDKVDPVYFQKMLEHFNVKAEDCIYFEHTPAAVESAKSVGIASNHFDEQKRDIDSLKAFLDSNL